MKCIVGFALALSLAAAARAAAPPVPVELGKAARGPVQSVLPTVGTVKALREVKVGSKIAERVATLLVDEGDPVKAGQVICELDVTDTKLQIDEAQAKLGEAVATLKRLEAGVRAQLITQAEATVEEQGATVEKLRLDAERIKTLFARGVASDAERDSAVADYETARARLKRVQAALALAREGTRKEEIAEAQATVALRKTELALVQQRLKDATITSPVTGYVVRKHVEEGQWTQVGGTVVEVIDTSVLRVHTHVTEKTIRKIREGQTAVIRLDAHPGKRFEAAVHRIIPRADSASRSFPVQIDVRDPEGIARPGMFARVSFILDVRDDVLLVPEDALVLSGRLTLLFKAMPIPKEMLDAMAGGQGGPAGGKKGGPPPGGKQGGPPGGMPPLPGPLFLASRVVVRTGARQEGMIEVREVVSGALKAGDLIVVTGNENLRDRSMMVVIRGLPDQDAGAPPAQPQGAPAATKPGGAAKGPGQP